MSEEQIQIKVHCSYDEMVGIDTVVRHPRNPNTHPVDQIRLLAKIILNQGWRSPITVSNLSGFIIKGHGRLDAAEMLKLNKVPIDRQDYENEAAEWADMVADNRIAELADMDRPLLKDLLEELDTGEFDMELTGFDDKALEDLMTEAHTDDQKKDDKMVTCPECNNEFSIK